MNKLNQNMQENITMNSIINAHCSLPNYNDIFEYNNAYYKILKTGGYKKISNFIITPRTLLKTNSTQTLMVTITLENNKQFDTQLDLNDFLTVSKFKLALNFIERSFLGNDSDLENIKTLISCKDMEIKTGITQSGFHTHNNILYFIAGGKCINNNIVDSNDLVMLPNSNTIDSNILDIAPITPDELKVLSTSLFKFNDPKVCCTILGYCAAIFLKERLKQEKIIFPHLFLVGESGSGKSSTYSNILSPILSLTTNSIGASGITKFTMDTLMESSNTFPLVIEEYKPTYLTKEKVALISTLIRESTDSNSSLRGQKDLTISNKCYNSPLVIIGEMFTDETAVIERSLLCQFTKKDISTSYSYYNFLFKNKELLQKFGRGLLNATLSFSTVDLLNNLDLIKNNIINIDTHRVLNNISIAQLGISIIEKLFNDLGLDFEFLTGFTKDAINEYITAGAFEDLLDSAHSSKSAISYILEKFNTLAELGYIQKNIDFKILTTNDKKELALHIPNIFPKYIEYLRKCEEHNTLGLRQFTKQLKTTQYFNTYKPVKLISSLEDKTRDISKKCYTLNIDELIASGLELDFLLNSN